MVLGSVSFWFVRFHEKAPGVNAFFLVSRRVLLFQDAGLHESRFASSSVHS